LVLVVRLIGPASYGLYGGAAAYVLFVAIFAQMGVEVYLIRRPGRIEAHHYDQAFTFLLVTSLATTAIAEGLTVALAPWLRPVGVVWPLRILLLSVPVNVLWAPAQAAIERSFRYRAMGLIELGGDVALYGVAVPLAMAGWGAWSLVVGYLAWQTWLLVASLVVSGLRLRLAWSSTEMRALLHHGLTFSSARWMAQSANLVNPMVVGAAAGAVGVGYVAFAQRLVETIAFGQRGAYRLGVVAMSKVGEDRTDQLRSSVEQGSWLLLLAVAVPFAGFGAAAHWVVPDLFGAQWTRALPVYSLLAVAAMLNSSQMVQVTLLYSKGRNAAVALSAVIRVAVLALAGVVFVHFFGLVGYGVATIAALVCTVSTDLAVRRMVKHFSYRRLIPWVVVLVPPVLMPLAPMPWAIGLLAPLALLALRPLRSELAALIDVTRSAVLGRPSRRAVGSTT
jgi:O-antigen/teichoic acid export membrane protein